MVRHRVRLSPQGQDYLNNPNCSTIVKSILSSIDAYSAEVLLEEENIVRVKLLDDTVPDEMSDFNNFAIHKEHIELY